MINRAPIPEPVKRELRQEAGFGCCKCGNPIFEYHHIVPRSEDPQDLMIFCPLCHHEATVGAMPEGEQRSHKSRPFNIANGYVEGKLRINQSVPAIAAGSVQFVGDGAFLVVDQEELISLSLDASGRLELSVELYDREDQLLALVERNEWISGDPLPWDLESGFQWIKLRWKLGDIALQIDARNFPIEIRGDLWRKGQNFQISRDWVRFNGVLQHIAVGNLCFVGFRLVADTASKCFKIQPDPRFGKGVIVSWPDIPERVRRGLECWGQLKVAERQPGDPRWRQ
jgi:hypothetical protein